MGQDCMEPLPLPPHFPTHIHVKKNAENGIRFLVSPQHYTNVSFLVLLLHYTMLPLGEDGSGYTGLCVLFLQLPVVYNYFKIN